MTRYVTHWFVDCRFEATSLDLASAILFFWSQK